VKFFHRRVTKVGWVPQDWSFYLAPVTNGIELPFVVKTGEVGLPEFYGVQQCFRRTGTANEAWQQKYARTAAFSEHDLWQDPPAGAELLSLTGALRNGSVKFFPAGKETAGCRTPYGESLDRWRSGGQLDTLEHVGTYNVRMLWTGDTGLILRTSPDRKWSTGLYWERTTHLSDHHPADFLQAIVNLGGMAPNSQRVLRGKIYWLAGPGETLVKHWREDFPPRCQPVQGRSASTMTADPALIPFRTPHSILPRQSGSANRRLTPPCATVTSDPPPTLRDNARGTSRPPPRW